MSVFTWQQNQISKHYQKLKNKVYQISSHLHALQAMRHHVWYQREIIKKYFFCFLLDLKVICASKNQSNIEHHSALHTFNYLISHSNQNKYVDKNSGIECQQDLHQNIITHSIKKCSFVQDMKRSEDNEIENMELKVVFVLLQKIQV